ncbi:MAG: protein-L-isoaspartate(D-aspartate) O-methyltransferase [Deltaproteobacteria bacterium]|nr:protein-L-isoaspartate(D-aspartate) O-methyltransferase [Deltaproteobacteria bacterium]
MDDKSHLVELVRRRGVRDPRLLAAMARIDRGAFIPLGFESAAYEDEPVPIGHGQVTTQPSLIAEMVEALELSGHERVLEVGAGYGFQTAILASLCKEVLAVEWFPDLARQARANLDAAGIRNATVVEGDGTRGLENHAPYDRIIVGAAAPSVPQPLEDQLVEGGLLVQPMGVGGRETVMVFRKQGGRLLEERILTFASFVPLRGERGVVKEEATRHEL